MAIKNRKRKQRNNKSSRAYSRSRANAELRNARLNEARNKKEMTNKSSNELEIGFANLKSNIIREAGKPSAKRQAREKKLQEQLKFNTRQANRRALIEQKELENALTAKFNFFIGELFGVNVASFGDLSTTYTVETISTPSGLRELNSYRIAGKQFAFYNSKFFEVVNGELMPDIFVNYEDM